MAQPEYRPREANFLADFLAGEASGSLKGAAKATASKTVTRCRLDVNMPYELLLRHQAIILGPHQYGRTVRAVREVPCCPLVLVEKYAASQGGRQLTLLRQLVTATQRLNRPLCVEYMQQLRMDWAGCMPGKSVPNPFQGRHVISCMDKITKKWIWAVLIRRSLGAVQECHNCPQLPSSVKQLGMIVKVPYKTLVLLPRFCPCTC